MVGEPSPVILLVWLISQVKFLLLRRIVLLDSGRRVKMGFLQYLSHCVRITVCICRCMHRHPYITTCFELKLNHELEQPSPCTSHSNTPTPTCYNKQLPKSTTIRLTWGDSYHFTCFSNITDVTLNY